MKPQHQIFIRGMITHGDKCRAYLAAYPHATGDAIRTAAGRLLRKPFIKEAIESVMKLAREKAAAELLQEATEQVKLQVCTLQQKRDVLARMISGEYKAQRFVRNKDGDLEEIYEAVKPHVVVQALKLDARLAGEELPFPKPIAPVKPLTKIVIEPQPLPSTTAERNPTQATVTVSNVQAPATKLPEQAPVKVSPIEPVTINSPLTKPEPFVTVSAAKPVKPAFPPADLWPYFFKAFPHLAGVNEAFSRSKEAFFRRLPRSSQLSLVQGPLDKERERLFGPPKPPVRNHPQPYRGRL